MILSSSIGKSQFPNLIMEERMSQSTFPNGCSMKLNKKNNGSITVETSIVLPIFVFAIFAFIFLLQVLYVQQEIQSGLQQVARYCEKLGYVYDYIENYEDNETIKTEEEDKNKETRNLETENQEIENQETKNIEIKNLAKGVITSSLMNVKFYDCVNQSKINQSCIVNGMKGIVFALSSYDEESDIADVVVKYNVHLPLGFFKFNDFRMSQRARVRVFVGSTRMEVQEDEDENDDYVYITETGTVYHESPDCTHLKLSITKIMGAALESKRNTSGAKYYACEICKPVIADQQIYYITTQGNRYHSNANCSGLKRTIKKVKRSEVEGRKACTRCGK